MNLKEQSGVNRITERYILQIDISIRKIAVWNGIQLCSHTIQSPYEHRLELRKEVSKLAEAYVS